MAAAATTEAPLPVGAGLWAWSSSELRQRCLFLSMRCRPVRNDTGMVTLAGTQKTNEFELQLRAVVLGIPIPAATFERMGSWKRRNPFVETATPHYEGVRRLLLPIRAPDIRTFGKPGAREPPAGVVGVAEPHGSSLEARASGWAAAAAKSLLRVNRYDYEKVRNCFGPKKG